MVLRTSKKIRRRRRSKKAHSFVWQIIKGILYLFVVSILVVCIYYVTRLPALTITSINIYGSETVSDEIIRGFVTTELEGTYFRLIPKRFTYLYPKERMIDSIKKISKVSSVDISRISRNELQVSFEEYIPHALLCLYASSSTPCFFMDDVGFAFVEAPSLNGGTFTRHFVTSSEDFKLGKVIEIDVLNFVDVFIEQSEKLLNFRINALTYMPDEDVSFIINGGGIILVSLKNDLDTTLENISAVLNSNEFEHIEPGNFQYIDARFKNKIFVNENISTSTESSKTLSE